jgi:molecular chaperone DnaK (HSP70)
MITEYFGRQPYKSVNPDEAIAYGAILSGISSDYVDKGIIGKKEMKMKKSKIQGIDDLDINKDKGNLLGEASDDDDNDNYHNFKDVSSKNMKEPEKKKQFIGFYER